MPGNVLRNYGCPTHLITIHNHPNVNSASVQYSYKNKQINDSSYDSNSDLQLR
jgi:hypothetical protein